MQNNDEINIKEDKDENNNEDPLKILLLR